MKHVLKVYRAERYSPNSEERDRAILDAVGRMLARQGLNVTGTDEDMLTADTPADIIISMARSAEALTALDAIGRRGAIVVNRPEGVRACKRSTADRLMRANNLPAAPLCGTDGYWIKRGDEAAQQRDDILFAKNEGKLVTRDMMRDALWDDAGAYVEENTLSVYIKRLRDKLEDDPTAPELIVTVRGLGYKLRGEAVRQ